MKNNGLIFTSLHIRYYHPGWDLIVRKIESVYNGVQRTKAHPDEDLLLLKGRK